jgi:hypothetical protein
MNSISHQDMEHLFEEYFQSSGYLGSTKQIIRLSDCAARVILK